MTRLTTRLSHAIMHRMRSMAYAVQDSAAGRPAFLDRSPLDEPVSGLARNAAIKVGCYGNWFDFFDAVRYLTPGSSGVWNDVAFVPPGSMDTDWVGIFNQPAKTFVEFNAAAHRVFFAIGEPPTRFHRPLHVGQGDNTTVFTCDADVEANSGCKRRYVLTPPMVRTWSVRRTYDQLKQCIVRDKPRQLSWITSDIAKLPGHRRRLEFLKRLRQDLRLDLYGRGFRRIYDKWDGLAPYRYSIAFENTRAPLYFTEKLMDCFVCETMPIYIGDPQISERFPPESLIVINPDATDAVEQIRAAVNSDLWIRNRDAILEAKHRVLNHYNLFAMLSQHLRNDARPPGPREAMKISAISLSDNQK